jgi:hypothetical protein
VELAELRRLASGLSEIAGSLDWVAGSQDVLADLGADVGSHRVQREVALVTEAAFRLMAAIAADLETTAWLAETAGYTYETVEASVIAP